MINLTGTVAHINQCNFQERYYITLFSILFNYVHTSGHVWDKRHTFYSYHRSYDIIHPTYTTGS